LDEEPTEYEEEINEEELPEEEIAETAEESSEENIETEQNEVEHAEPTQITIQKLPWDGVQTTACGENSDSIKNSRAVWGDGTGNVYFGGPEFWVFTEIGDGGTLVCDSRVKGVFSMDGRVADGSTEIWVGLTGQIARLRGGLWTVYDIPAEVATGDVIDIDIAGNFISALTADALALYNTTDGTWHKVTNCPEDLNRMYGLAYDGQTLWASAGMRLYKIGLTSKECALKMAIEESLEPNYSLGILNGNGGLLWFVKMEYFTTMTGGDCKTLYILNGEKLEKLNIETHVQTRLTAISSGMGGMPIMQFDLDSRIAPFSGCQYPDSYLFGAGYVFEIYNPNYDPLALSDKQIIIEGCTNSEVADQIVYIYQKEIESLKSWRDGNVLWHLYGGPTKYSY